MGAFSEIGPWTWFVVGGLLLIAEIFMPGVFLWWLGLAALATGALAYVVTVSWQVQVLAFAGLSVLAILLGRKVAPAPDAASDRPFLNRRAAGFVGRVFTLDAPIEGGVGRVRIDDTVWRVEGPDVAAGREVKVVAADGATLKVEPA